MEGKRYLKSQPNYYDILEVSRDASPEVIKRSFRRLAMKHHPDRKPDDPAAAGITSQIIDAYEVLSDPAKRALYSKAVEGETLPIKMKSAEWLLYLRDNHVIVESRVRKSKQFRLSERNRFYISADQFNIVKSKCDANGNTFGLFLFSLRRQRNRIIYVLQSVFYAESEWGLTSERFAPNNGSMKRAATAALDNGLLPCLFYNHPLKGIVFSRKLYCTIPH